MPENRTNKGRRREDAEARVQRLEVHPMVTSLVGATVAVLLAITGYLVRGWAENISKEIGLLRQAVEKQSVASSANVEWRSSMTKWREEVDDHLRDVDNRLNTLPWSVRRSRGRTPARWPPEEAASRPNTDAKTEQEYRLSGAIAVISK